MAARYVRIGQHPDYRDEIRGTLSEILLSPNVNPGTYAAPEDVTGTYLEMGSDGLWTGASVGTLTQVQADALVASGALATVKVGTPGNVAGTLVRYGGVGVGWVDAARNANQASFGNRCVWDGDSITVGFGGVQTMAAILNGKMIIVKNYAKSGEKISQMLARIAATLSLSPNIVWLMAGTNDAIQGTSLASYSADLIAYIKTVQRSGAQLILSLIPPNSGTGAGNLNAQNINACIHVIASNYGIPLCDPWELYRANDGTWVAGASSDNTHPYPFVVQDAAASANTQLSGFLNSIPSVYPCLAQPDGGLRTNNLFLTDTNADGVADGFNVMPGAINTITNATLPKLGKIQKMEWSSYAGDSDALIFGGTVAPGDKILFVSRITFDPKANTNTKIEIKLVSNYGSKTHGALFGGSPVNFTKAFSGVAAYIFTAVDGATTFDAYLQVQRNAGGVLTASVEISQMQFYNLTSLGLA